VHQASEGTVESISLQGMLAFSWSAASEDYFDTRRVVLALHLMDLQCGILQTL
jgi:hypothetical protein